MPQMADITVKKADGSTSITFAALTPSSGDKTAAQWRCETVGAAAGLRPTLTLASSFNEDRTARRLQFNFQYPETVTESSTGVSSVRNRIPARLTFTVPTAVPDSVVAEAVAQCANLLSSTLIQSSLKTGYAPT